MFKKRLRRGCRCCRLHLCFCCADVLCSPVKGKVIKMADVPDPVFGGEVLARAVLCGPRTIWSTLPATVR